MGSLSEKIKILVFVDWYYPAYKAGGPIRSIINLIDHLHEEFEFYVVTSDRDLGDVRSMNQISVNKWVSLNNAKVIYLTPRSQRKRIYRSLFNEVKPHVIYFNSLFSLKFMLLPFKVLNKENVKVVIAPRGMLGKESLKIKKTKKQLFFMLIKGFKFFNNVHWHASSEIELQEIQNVFGASVKSDVIPNLSPNILNEAKNTFKEIGSISVLCVCRIAPIKNLTFLFEVLSEVKIKLDLNLIGPIEDHGYWGRCNKQIHKLPVNCRINYLGEKNTEQIREEVKKNHLLISTSLNEN